MTVTTTSISHKKQQNNPSRKFLEPILARAGIRIDGYHPWDIRIHNDAVFSRIRNHGTLGLGEAYMDGWWSCDQLDEMFCKLFKAGLRTSVRPWVDRFLALRSVLVNLQRKSRAWEVGRRHYDIGNNLYREMLDERMIYSCGYWKHADNLNAAQEAKLDLVCRKLYLEPGMRVLDIGCGWGGAARFAAENYGVKVVGVTVSAEQAASAADLCRNLPVEIQLKNYTDIRGRFDRIFSLGMFEHVGFKNYHKYMQFVADRLEQHGLFLLHTVGSSYTDTVGNAWVNRYIFPNSMLPSAAQIGRAAENRLVMEDWQNFGPDYDRTLMAWFENFERAWPDLEKKYDEHFYRMWKYYLLSFAGSFRARENQLWQVVFSKNRYQSRYDSPR